MECSCKRPEVVVNSDVLHCRALPIAQTAFARSWLSRNSSRFETAPDMVSEMCDMV